MQRLPFFPRPVTNAAVRNVPDRAEEPEALTRTEADALFAGLFSFSNLALAVSGGADSLSLMVLFDDWRRRAGWTGLCEVLVVDHGLRAESGQEAEFVMAEAARLGLRGAILRWQGPKPDQNLQEAARQARYALMASRMGATGAQALLLGHHLDDQAETFLDRLTRGSGLSGLSAMAADEREGPEGLHLLRPLLGLRKARLEASLRARGLSWCADPSNRDEKYKRSRLRRIMGLLEDEGLSPDRLVETAAHLRRARQALEVTVNGFADEHVTHHPAGPARVERQAYAGLPDDLRLRFLNRITQDVTGLRPRPRFSRLRALDEALRAGEPARQCLSGAVFEADGVFLWCWREAGRQPPETVHGLTGEGIWDRRFKYQVLPDAVGLDKGEGLSLGPFGASPLKSSSVVWPCGWPKEAFECAPVLWTQNREVVRLPEMLDLRVPENNHGSSFRLARLPFRGKLAGN